ncbi:MAG: Glycosyl transferase, group 2 family [Candidatus Curtissbacteria bacterium GW2011_GWA1_41_11]|uniref:Glycosyl transferase, group 2 family n=1 Tax=Candidatus Curtissbacteria bacterium GW2011_GWA1_41_11 TaxID=1618409 RepID=A0A0G0UIA1_9BACT|nr:MAG: Glycosyl transferase, group 2 family [Candidatus Curtissbacteria bacterium GW2011_GWA1_41_11]
MNQPEITISAVILTRNEEARIEACLKSLSWVDEVVVIDNGSSDKTVALAKKTGAKVTLSVEKDFSRLRDIGKEKTTGDWILYVDADEIVPEALRSEIIERTKSKGCVAYCIRRKNYYLGNPWPYQDKMQRLFLRNALVGWHGAVHETATVNGPTETLHSPLEHHTHRTLEEMVAKTNEWSVVEARLRLDAHHPPVVWWRLVRVMITGFWESFVRNGGWRAGTVGFIESIYQGYSMFITYAKLWEMQVK